MKKTLLFIALLTAFSHTKAQSYDLSVSSLEDFNSKWTVQTDGKTTEEIKEADIFKNININFGAVGYAALKNSPITLAASKSNTTQWKIYVDYLQPNGDLRYLKIATQAGDKVTIKLKEAYELSDLSTSTGIASGLTGSVAAGESFTIIASDTEIVLINTSAKPKIQNITIGDANTTKTVNLDKRIKYKDNEITNSEGLNLFVYNSLGKIVANSNHNISMANYTSGVYMVRAEGVKGAFKFSK